MRKLTAIVFLGLLAVTAACSKKKAPEPTPAPPAPSQDNGWKPEPGRPTDAATGGAAYWNAQGVLKRVHFDFDKSEIRADQVPVLEANARWIKDHPQFDVVIEGHCDERDTEEYNLALGERRASAVRAYLARLGVGEARLSTVSYGEERPAASGHSEDAWAMNRRGEFVLRDR